MEDLLSRILPCVENDTVAAVFDSPFLCDPSGGKKNRADEAFLIFAKSIKGGDVFLWNDKDMNRSLRFDILEGKYPFVFVHDFSGDFFTDDFTKDTVFL